MVAIVEIDEHSLDHLDHERGLDRTFTMTVRSQIWAGRKPHLTLIVSNGELRAIARAEGGQAVSTFDKRITISRAEEVDRTDFDDFIDGLPKRNRIHVREVGVQTDAVGRALTDRLLSIYPDDAQTIKSLGRDDRVFFASRGSDVLGEQRDATGLVLDFAGFDRDLLRSWQPPSSEDRVSVPFLAGLSGAPSREDALVDHDVSVFLDWQALGCQQHSWRVFQNADGERLFVMNANRTRMEEALGVDVIYWNERRGAFVIVQYKRFTRDRSGNLEYRPDSNLSAELNRMRDVETLAANATGEYRLSVGPARVKLCNPSVSISDPAVLVKGMYFALPHFEELLARKGARGGTVINYRNTDRYLNNSQFSDLVAGGWIGSRGSGSDLIRRVVEESFEGHRSVVLGALLSTDSST